MNVNAWAFAYDWITETLYWSDDMYVSFAAISTYLNVWFVQKQPDWKSYT